MYTVFLNDDDTELMPTSFRFESSHSTVSQKILKSPGQENSRNQIVQFDEIFFDQIPFFAISKMAVIQFLN